MERTSCSDRYKAFKQEFEASTTENASLTALCDAIRSAKSITFVLGAGISVPCGIPDFRSANGLYKVLDTVHFEIPCAELLFDSEYFNDDPKPLFRFVSDFLDNDYKPGIVHYFLKAICGLVSKTVILTQNIDGLEEQAGIPRSQIIECHGRLTRLVCPRRRCELSSRLCRNSQLPTIDTSSRSYWQSNVHLTTVDDDDDVSVVTAITTNKRKRSSSHITSSFHPPTCPHHPSMHLRPDVVLFGENVPAANIKMSRKSCTVIVIGTSCSVRPIKGLIDDLLATSTRSFLINASQVTHLNVDHVLIGNAEQILTHASMLLDLQLDNLDVEISDKLLI